MFTRTDNIVSFAKTLTELTNNFPLLRLRWRHKILVLFKLILLEKRVLFFGSPVKPVCATILSLISLHPQLLNKGLCNEFEPKELTFQFTPASPVLSPDSVTSEKSAETEKSDDCDSLKQITILPSMLKVYSINYFKVK